MSDIQAIFAQMNDVEATISILERGDAPEGEFAQQLAMESLHRRREELSQMAKELSEQQLIDVCDYRILPDSWGRYPVKGVTGAISSFQDMFTAFFGAIRENRPRHKGAFDQTIIAASTLNLGYAYSGSLGIVMYVPSDTLLPVESDQDAAIHAIFELSRQDSPNGVRAIAERFGRAPVRRFYEWSEFHLSYGLSAAIKWQRGDKTKEERTVQPEELELVVALINAASDSKQSTESVEGVLVALDVTRHSFKLSFPESPDIRGIFDDDFDWKVPHEIPGRYRARLKRRTTTLLWSDVDTVAWTLLDLAELK
jgi:hypothetical protein